MSHTVCGDHDGVCLFRPLAFDCAGSTQHGPSHAAAHASCSCPSLARPTPSDPPHRVVDGISSCTSPRPSNVLLFRAPSFLRQVLALSFMPCPASQVSSMPRPSRLRSRIQPRKSPTPTLRTLASLTVVLVDSCELAQAFNLSTRPHLPSFILPIHHLPAHPRPQQQESRDIHVPF